MPTAYSASQNEARRPLARTAGRCHAAGVTGRRRDCNGSFCDEGASFRLHGPAQGEGGIGVEMDDDRDKAIRRWLTPDLAREWDTR